MATTKREDRPETLELFEGMSELREPKVRVAGVDEALPLSDEQRGARAARDRFAESIGADAGDISVVYEDIGLALMEGGVLVDIDVHCWSGEIKLQAKELGIDRAPSSKVIRLGEKLLMPPFMKRRVGSLVSRLRQNLDKHSHRTAWGRWLPALAYNAWKLEHDDLVEELEEIGRELATNLEIIKTSNEGMWGELRRLYSEEARRAWCRSNHYAISEDNLERVPGWFVEEYVSRILAHIPPADEIRRSFHVEAKISFIPLPSMLAEDKAREERVWQRASEERDFERRQREAEEQMQADIRAQYEAQKSAMLESFLADLAGQVYSKLYDVSSWVLNTSARNQGRLIEPSIRQIKGLVDWARMMDINNDVHIQQAISDLEGLVSQSAEARSVEDVMGKLKDIGVMARSALLDMRLAPELADEKLSVKHRDALLGIGARLSRADVTDIRERLGTADVADIPIVQLRRGRKVEAFQEIQQI